MATFDINPVTQINQTVFASLSDTEKIAHLMSKLNELIDRNKTLLDTLREMPNDSM